MLSSIPQVINRYFERYLKYLKRRIESVEPDIKAQGRILIVVMLMPLAALVAVWYSAIYFHLGFWLIGGLNLLAALCYLAMIPLSFLPRGFHKVRILILLTAASMVALSSWILGPQSENHLYFFLLIGLSPLLFARNEGRGVVLWSGTMMASFVFFLSVLSNNPLPYKVPEIWITAFRNANYASFAIILMAAIYFIIRMNESLRVQAMESASLVQTLHEVQSAFIESKPQESIFNQLKVAAQSISGSTLGFFATVRRGPDQTRWIRILEANDGVAAFDAANCPLLKRTLESTSHFIIDDDIPAEGLPPGFPRLQSFLGIPLRIDNEVIGLIGLANRIGGYSPDLVQRLQPLAEVSRGIILARVNEMRRLESEQRLDLALSAGELGLWDWNCATGKLILNQRCSQISGYPLEHFSNLADWENLIHAEFRLAVDDTWKTYETGMANRFEATYPLRHASGQEIWVHEKGLVVERDEKGHALRAVGTVHDITRQKRQESDLRDARQRAEQANQLKSEFLATMSHEIRTPLNGILGFAHLLSDTSLEGEQKEYVATINRSGELLMELINDILDLSKIEAGQIQLEKQTIPVHTACTDVLGLVRGRAKEKNLELRLEIPSDQNLQVNADPSRLRQVLLNLLSNAIKFTEKGWIRLRVEAMEKRIRFQVTDTGIGIPESVQGRLFQKFVQADASTTRRFGGTGLGLAITKQLLELMEGHIEIKSASGVGSTFEFTLPRQATESWTPVVAQDEGPAAPAPIIPASTGAGLRILVAEDNIVNQKLIQRILTKLGCRCDMVSHGGEALELLEQLPYDLVFMDCQMPVMDGYEATRRWRESEKLSGRPPQKIVALTANVMEGDREKCLEAGMDDYMAKPINPAKLSQILAQIGQEKTKVK